MPIVQRSACALLLASLLYGLPGVAMAQSEELLWGVVPLSGAFNVREGQVVGGLLFEAMQILAAQLPELQMRYEVLPMLRIEQRMAGQSEICSSGQLQSPARDRVGYFVPYLVSTPMHVLVRRQTLEQLRIEDGQVSLDWLLGNPYLRGALATNRVYPPDIHEQLLHARAEGRIAQVGGSLAGENLLLMVSHRRLDYVFDYPLIYTEVTRHFSLSDALVSVPLRESSQLVTVGIYCSRSKWGARMAKRLDQAVREVAATPASTLLLYQRWLPPEVFGHYREQLLEFFAQRASAPPLLFD